MVRTIVQACQNIEAEMSLPYFPMYPSDFEAKTSHLTLAEDGAYNRLLRIMWMTSGCTIPDNRVWIMRRLRCSEAEFDEVVSVVIDEFFDATGGRLSNAKLLSIYVSTNEAHNRRVNAGAKGGKAKALKTNNTKPSNALAMAKQPEPEPEPEPVVKKDIVHFDLFWSIWPNKSSKQTAVKAWDKLTVEDQRAVIDLPRAGFDAWQRSAPNANPILPASFLNQRRWEDAPLLNGGHNGHGTNHRQSRGDAQLNEAVERAIRIGSLPEASEPSGF